MILSSGKELYIMNNTSIEQKLEDINKKLLLLIKNAQRENQSNFAENNLSNRVFLVLGFGLSLILTAIALIINDYIFLLISGSFIFLAGLLHSIALKLNSKAYFKNKELYYEIKKIGGWTIPFGKAWCNQFYKGIKLKNNLFVISLIIETLVYLSIFGIILITTMKIIEKLI